MYKQMLFSYSFYNENTNNIKIKKTRADLKNSLWGDAYDYKRLFKYL
jgi:hypothetical protein